MILICRCSKRYQASRVYYPLVRAAADDSMAVVSVGSSNSEYRALRVTGDIRRGLLGDKTVNVVVMGRLNPTHFDASPQAGTNIFLAVDRDCVKSTGHLICAFRVISYEQIELQMGIRRASDGVTTFPQDGLQRARPRNTSI